MGLGTGFVLRLLRWRLACVLWPLSLIVVLVWLVVRQRGEVLLVLTVGSSSCTAAS